MRFVLDMHGVMMMVVDELDGTVTEKRAETCSVWHMAPKPEYHTPKPERSGRRHV